MASIQESSHGQGHDYLVGSPHLAHASLSTWIRDLLNGLVNQVADNSSCAPRVLEVGAGHGSFTETLAAAGAEVIVTEMSAPSARVLEKKFRHNPAVRVVHDPQGDFASINEVDIVLYMSVLHHIPDYLGNIRSSMARLAPGGAFASFQDPLWYPRKSKVSVAASRAATLTWRLSQGNIARGVGTQLRRIRGVWEVDNPSDMSEYHVVRQGVDEEEIGSLLRGQFDDVVTLPYWSTQAGWLQALGSRWAAPNTFGILATGKH